MNPPRRGLTLVELVVVIALLAVVATLAMPYFGSVLARHRLKAAAETLAADIAQARFEAANRGSALYVNVRGSSQPWCWSVATAPGCDCQTLAMPTCRLKAVRQQDFKGVSVRDDVQLVLQANGTAAAAQSLTMRSPQGEQLRVSTGPTGRAHVCSPEAPTWANLPRC